MGNAVRRDQEIAGGHREFSTLEQKQALTFDDLVNLVLTCVRVERMFLSGLECIEADQEACRFENRALAHFRGRIRGVIRRPNDGGVGGHRLNTD